MTSEPQQRQLPNIPEALELHRYAIFGGNSTLSVTNPKGESYTFKVKKFDIPGKEMPSFSVFWVRYNDEPVTLGTVEALGLGHSFYSAKEKRNFANGKPVYLGLIDPTFRNLYITQKSTFISTSIIAKVATFMIKVALGLKQLPKGYKLEHNGRCSACGRELTNPDSIKLGIGPVCIEKVGAMMGGM